MCLISGKRYSLSLERVRVLDSFQQSKQCNLTAEVTDLIWNHDVQYLSLYIYKGTLFFLVFIANKLIWQGQETLTLYLTRTKTVLEDY